MSRIARCDLAAATAHVLLKNLTCEKSRACGVPWAPYGGLNQGFPRPCAPSAARTAKLPRCLRGRDRVCCCATRARCWPSPPWSSRVLGILGTGVDSRLSPTSLDVPGTPSSKANAVLREHFGQLGAVRGAPARPGAGDRPPGPGAGPRPARQRPADHHPLALGPRLGRAPAAEPAAGADRDRLPRRAGRIGQRLRRRARTRSSTEQIHPPVRATQTGYATLSRAIQDESIDAAERSELIALPILLIVLLLVFRSPIAAAIPLVFGAVDRRQLPRPALHTHRLVRHRRLRAHGLHDDGPGARASTTPC